jgi:hypothetical protein
MTKKVRLFLTMLFLTLLGGVNAAWAGEVDITPDQALNQGGVDPITIVCAKGDGTSNPAISSGQLRLYQAASGKTTGNTITFSSEYAITSIEFTFANSMTADNGVFSEGTYDSATSTWTGSTNSVTLTVTGTKSGERIYISAMTVTYEGGGTVIQTVAAPTFSPAGGTFTDAQSVEISTTTDGATIYYTTDGSNPTTSSNVYSSAISVEETTTIKAIAVKDGMNNSSVAEATYTIISIDGEAWVETSLAALTEDDVFVIVGDNGSTYALSNDNGTGAAPSAVTVTVSDGVLVGTPAANIQWNLSGNASNGYTFYPNGSTSTWLYCTNTNNGVRVGDNDSKTFSIDNGYLKHNGTNRYVGIYNSQDWRCYTSINSNITGQTFKFYKKPTTAPAVAKPTFDPADGEYTEAQSVTITCTTEGSTIYYTTDGTEPTNQSTPYTGAIAVSETTIIKAIAYVGTDASSVATATYTIVEPLSLITIAEAREQTGEVLTAGTVTSVNGKTAYIQDETAAIVVYGNSNLNVTVGDAITVQGELTTYNGLLEIKNPTITVTTQGNTVEPEVMAIADISNDNQAELIKIESATVTAIDGKNVTIAQGQDEITVFFNNTNDITFAVKDVITLTGNIGCYNTPQIANPRDITVTENVKYYLVGTMTSWLDNKAQFQRQADGTYKVEGQTVLNNDEFKIIKEEGSSITWYGGATDDGNNYVIHDEWYNNIPLTEGDAGKNFQIQANEECNFTFVLDVDNMTITVTGWPRKHYYVIGQGVGSLEGMQEMTYNEDKGVYELEVTYRDTDAPGYWFAISDLASASSWDELNNGHRYAVQEGDYTLTKENSRNVQLIKANGSMMVYNAGTYTLTLTEDRELTVTGWPIILDGNAFVKVTSTDELTDGHYLIVYEGDDKHASVAFDGSYEDASGKLDAANNIIDVAIAEKLIIANDATNAAAFLIEESDGSYTIQSSNGKYIGKTANSNGLDASETNAYTNTISFEDGEAIITASGNCTLRYNYASDQQRFRYYKSGQQPIALYKLTTVDEIPVTIGSTGYSTLYYSDKALAIPEGMTAQYVSQVGDNDGKITFTEINNHFIPKNTAVVLKATQGSYTFFEIPGSEEFAPADNLLLGTDAAELTTAKGWAENLDCKFYMLSRNSKGEDKSVGFYFAKNCPNGEAFTNGAHKAYLAVPKSLNAKSCYLFSEAEIADGIGAVESPMFNTEDLKIYNLNGQRVSTLQRGIYIINGKKVLVK